MIFQNLSNNKNQCKFKKLHIHFYLIFKFFLDFSFWGFCQHKYFHLNFSIIFNYYSKAPFPNWIIFASQIGFQYFLFDCLCLYCANLWQICPELAASKIHSSFYHFDAKFLLICLFLHFFSAFKFLSYLKAHFCLGLKIY